MSRKEVLEHIIDILYEQLLLTQINEQWTKDESSEVDGSSLQLQSILAQYTRDIDTKSKQIVIAKRMLKELRNE